MAIAFSWACPTSEPASRLRCVTDQDCATDARCLVDLSLDETYCAALCTTSADCQPYESCEGKITATSGVGPEDRICVDRVRECQTEERCNGLDDDCDETIDNAGCTLITGCTNNSACGAFVCQAPAAQFETLCAPPNASAAAADFETCQQPSDCENNLCDHGVCSPICDPVRAELGCPAAFDCVEGLGDPTAPPHNTCAEACRGQADCGPGTTCVWRRVARTPDVHGLVCSLPVPTRKPLGAACSGFGSGDDECESGLCFSCRCTRACTGEESCADVDGAFRCIPRRLPYGVLEYNFRVCSATVSVGSCGGGS